MSTKEKKNKENEITKQEKKKQGQMRFFTFGKAAARSDEIIKTSTIPEC